MRPLYCLPFLIPLALLVRLLSRKGFLNWLKSLQVFSYKREPTLFSPAERSFLGVLDQVLGSEYRVFGKVRIADLIKPGNGAGRQAALNRIIAKHVDFVVCDPGNLSVIGVVELDDKSHDLDDRRNRDALVDGALGSAGIPIARFRARKSYNHAKIRDSIQQSFNVVLQQDMKPPIPLRPVIKAKTASVCDFSAQRGQAAPANKR